MNVLLCIGCNQYDYLHPLSSAERDARSMFETLGSGEFYTQDQSILLLSPSVDGTTQALSKCLRSKSINIFTFFFAGHAGGKNGSFFLALRESEVDALSSTAFPLSRLFEMVNEFQPRQVNIIIDGCAAGCSTRTLRTLLRPEDIGTIGASSITFFGACAADQSAGESVEGGLLTTHLLRVLRGESDLDLKKPIIELADIASHVSKAVAKDATEQCPIWWGLNLYGHGGLSLNPRFHISSPLPPLSITTVASESAMGKQLSAFSAELWDEYRLTSKEFQPQRLNDILQRLLAPGDFQISDRAAAVSGLLGSFLPVVASDGDLLAKHFCVAACLTPLQPWVDHPSVSSLVRQQLQLDFEKTNKLLEELLAELRTNSCCLLSDNGLLADIYYLPMRITRLLGVVGMLALIGYLLDFETEASKSFHCDFIKTVISVYPDLFVALDDEQAAPLYIFLKAAQLFSWESEGQAVLQFLYSDAAVRGGVFNRLGADGEEALEHSLIRCESELASKKHISANPSTLLPIILLGGVWFKCAADWDLRAFDRRNMGLFFPNTYRDFSEVIISHGFTHTHQVGFGIWNPNDLASYFDDIVLARKDDDTLAPEGHALCMLTSMLYPNRVPFCLEHLVTKTQHPS